MSRYSFLFLVAILAHSCIKSAETNKVSKYLNTLIQCLIKQDNKYTFKNGVFIKKNPFPISTKQQKKVDNILRKSGYAN